MSSALSQCGWLTGVSAVLWLILAGPAHALRGNAGLEGLTYAGLLCLLPGWLVFLLGSRYGSAKNQAVGLLAGTVVRLMFVLFGVVLIQSVRPDLGFWEFLVWVLAFYLVTLLLETLLIVRQASQSSSDKSE